MYDKSHIVYHKVDVLLQHIALYMKGLTIGIFFLARLMGSYMITDDFFTSIDQAL